MLEDAWPGLYRTQDSEKLPGVAAYSTSRKVAHFFLHIQDSTGQFAPALGKAQGFHVPPLPLTEACPRINVLIFGIVDSDTEEVSALLRFQHHSFDGVSRHSLDACQKLPLIRIWRSEEHT